MCSASHQSQHTAATITGDTTMKNAYPQWIDGDKSDAHPCRYGFVHVFRYITRPRMDDEVWLSPEPMETNVSREPRLYGWCGTYNDEYRAAGGLAQIVRENRDGTRIRLRYVRDPAEMTAVLARIAPELLDQVPCR